MRSLPADEGWSQLGVRSRLQPGLLISVLLLVAVFAGFFALGRLTSGGGVRSEAQPVVGTAAGATIPAALGSAAPLDAGVVVAPAPRPRAATQPAVLVATRTSSAVPASSRASVRTVSVAAPVTSHATPAPAATPVARPAPRPAPSGGGHSGGSFGGSSEGSTQEGGSSSATSSSGGSFDTSG